MNLVSRNRDWLALIPVFVFYVPSAACTLCGGNLLTQPTLLEELRRSPIVLVGKLGQARENPNATGGGTTEFHIERVVQGGGRLDRRGKLLLPRFLPEDPRQRKTWVLFGDVRHGQFDYLTARSVSGPAIADYLKAILAIQSKPQPVRLAFVADRLDHAAPEIAEDAFLELSRATDADVGRLARQLDAKRLRAMLANPRTPPERLSLVAFLLSGCGDRRDAALLRSMLDSDNERFRSAYGGLLAGYIVLDPEAAWKLAVSVMKDAKRSFLQRYAVIGTMRFLHGWRGNEDRARTRTVFRHAIGYPDLADMVVEDLRRWNWWDLTSDVLATAAAKSHDGPIMRRAIVRYALSCPDKEAMQYIADQRRIDSEFVAEMEESLRDEK